MTFIKCAHALLLAMLLPAAVSLTVFPALGKTGDENRLKINISGTVIATGKCLFINPNPPDVNFGNIYYSSVAGVNNITGSYTGTLDTRISCSGDTAGHAFLRFQSQSGTPVSDGSHKLLPVSVLDSSITTNENLGIRLLVNGKIQDVDTAFSVDPGNMPKLEVELVQLNPDDKTWKNGLQIVSHAILTLGFD
ncbi:hypothetical protein AB7160_15310 [Morganella morganii]|uniref:hypothetical protein n=1 Tax=Morganella morganii TaxID=582 RepID=UPI00190B19DA|nr:hypothetical protein [Morganella morganii]QQO72153.1 hypothetical protein IDH72_17195 [Morganella morganii]